MKRMRWMVIWAWAALLFPVAGVHAQFSGIDEDPILVRVKAKLVSMGDSMPVPYANIVYPRHRTGTTTNASGFFSIEMLNVDSLIVSAMGYKSRTLKIPRNYNETTTLTFFMQPVVYAIREVEVTGDKNRPNMEGIPVGKPSDVPVELRGDSYNEKPPVLAALFNPLSYWQYYLSRKEKQKREVREAVALEKNWEMHSRNYNKEVVKMLTGLNDEEADDFMVWFNAQNVLPYTSTEYEVRAAVRHYFEEYRHINGGK
ncbi:MAG TPA: carboxypeptidase-like regulatory domain-containing protein [Prolixibacteraceae bacterium]|nr:carboxypeptidase-like regulatory domain-containing protein [Prolixibacteraceae bacterium]